MPEPVTPARTAAGSPLLPGVVVAGYRLLRQVSGSSSDWLATAPGSGETLSVTVGRPSEALDRQVVAHCSIRSPHVQRLVDLATDAEGRVVLVLERTDWSLATLLASRAQVAPGEAVTILAPLATGLAAVHRAGYSYGELTPATVLFCPDGRPVLGRLGDVVSAESTERDTGLPPPAAATADLRAFANLIAAVADVVNEPARAGFVETADWIADQTLEGQSAGSLLGQVECRLFALAPALPVVLVPDRRPPDNTGIVPLGRRNTIAVPVLSHRGGATQSLPRSRIVTAIAATGLGGWAQRMLRGRALAVGLATAVLAATLVAGLAMIPESGPASAPAATAPGTETPPSLPAVAPGELPGTALPTPRPSVTPSMASPRTAAGTLDGEDPVSATVLLLRLRAACIDDRTAACVSGYAERASALADADTRALGRSGGDGVLLAGDETEPDVRLVQSYGDAALLLATQPNERRQPVSVLAVRTDTGWRLRDLFEPD